ncbi:MAG TPA: hypothetical protein VHI13_05140 [Candidatus Kapabacteria bacterium]|nr:hypothetical protein [Candidatus Kapabacteria bacterium]
MILELIDPGSGLTFMASQRVPSAAAKDELLRIHTQIATEERAIESEFADLVEQSAASTATRARIALVTTRLNDLRDRITYALGISATHERLHELDEDLAASERELDALTSRLAMEVQQRTDWLREHPDAVIRMAEYAARKDTLMDYAIISVVRASISPIDLTQHQLALVQSAPAIRSADPSAFWPNQNLPGVLEPAAAVFQRGCGLGRCIYRENPEVGGYEPATSTGTGPADDNAASAMGDGSPAA